MNANLVPRKVCLGQLILLLILLGLTGCGILDSLFVQDQPTGVLEGNPPGEEVGAGEFKSDETGIEPTPTMGILSYTNQEYGFKFDYPETWKLTEGDHAVFLEKGSHKLDIRFRVTDEIFDPYSVRTGLPAGDLIYEDKILFLDQVIPAEYLIFEKKYKAVYYGGTGWIEIDDLLFRIELVDLETANYREIDLSEELLTEAKSIVESFKRIDRASDSDHGSIASKSGLIAHLEIPERLPVGESLNIKFTVENVSDIPIYVLKWYTPLEGIAGEIFRVTHDGQVVPYEGILASRMPPTADAYVFLNPGESASAVVDLSKSYNFSQLGEYRIKFISPRISHIARTEAEMANTYEELGPVDIPSNEVSIEIVGSLQGIDYPRLRTLADAQKMIKAFLRDQGLDLGVEPILPVEELHTGNLWTALDAQVFRVIGGVFANESFLIRGNAVIQMGTVMGGPGINSMMVADLDRDGHAELLFTYVCGNGKRYSKIAMYAPAFDKNMIIEAKVLYLGSLSLIRDAYGVGLRSVEAYQDTQSSGFQDSLCHLAIEDQNGQVALVLES